METPPRRSKRYAPAASFDVTCVIGTVEVGEGEHTPGQAAFLLIAQHDAPGHYSFPGPHEGSVIRVTVEHEGMER